jgi:sec-independent protein translocase protein TatA
MRIFKSEIRELKKDGHPDTMDGTGPVEGRDVNHPQAGATKGRTGGTAVPPSRRT